MSTRLDYKLGFIILRANPFTLAHKKLLEYALEQSNHLIVFIGSANAPLTEKTPFPAELRQKMIASDLQDFLSKITFEELDDYYDNETWSRAVKGKVNRIKNKIYNEMNQNIEVTMFGGKKEGDLSTFYFDLFPETFCYKDITYVTSEDATSASDIREAIFSESETVCVGIPTNAKKDHQPDPYWLRKLPFHSIIFKFFSPKKSFQIKEFAIQELISQKTLSIINEFTKTTFWQEVKAEREYNRFYTLRVQYPIVHFLSHLQSLGKTELIIDGKNVDLNQLAYDYYKRYRPYCVQGNAVDCVVRSNNQYLLIKRKNFPCKNNWALPGGIIEPHETRISAALRELKEETGLRMMKDALLDCLIGEFDQEHPLRDPRLRMFSKVFIFELPDNKENLLKAGSDAQDYAWLTYEEILSIKNEIAFDHLSIVREAEKIRKKNPLRYY